MRSDARDCSFFSWARLSRSTIRFAMHADIFDDSPASSNPDRTRDSGDRDVQAARLTIAKVTTKREDLWIIALAMALFG